MNVSRGDDKETFFVYNKFICHYSPFFDAAFNSSFIEGRTQEITMDECSPAAFQLFINWMYSCNHRIEPDTIIGTSQMKTEALVALWLLADRCLVSFLQNQALRALDQVREKTRYRIASSSAVVYENTSDDSPLRRYLVRMIATSATMEDMETMAGMPREMLVDIIALLKSEECPLYWCLRPWEWAEFSVEERRVCFLILCCASQLTCYLESITARTSG